MPSFTTAILLAAGESRRMGSTNKLLLPYQSQPLIRHIARQILAARIDELIIVTGHEPEKLLEALQPLPFQQAHNPDYRNGMTSSIQTGIQAANSKSTAFLIALSDLPLLQTNDYNILIDHFYQIESPPSPILIPSHQGQRGHPIIFHPTYKEEILQHPEAEGCKGIIKAHPHAAVFVEMPNDHILRDMDTPGAYQNLMDSH